MPSHTLTYTKEEIAKLVKQTIEIEYQRKVTDVRFNIENQYEDRPSGGSYPVLRDIEVVLGDKIESKFTQYDK